MFQKPVQTGSWTILEMRSFKGNMGLLLFLNVTDLNRICNTK
jgi:hypothetical protein